MKTTTVIIVNYNTCAHLRACLTSVLPQEPYEVVVVDNGSNDESVKMVRTEFAQVTIHADGKNRGYGAGANRAAAYCASDTILLLNSDTRLQPGAINQLSAYLEKNPDVAVVGPRLRHPDGEIQQSCFPFPRPIYMFLEETRVGKMIAHIPKLRRRYLYTWSHDHARTVPWVQGSALAIRRSAFQSIGGFDESFFMYFEEVDLCYRLAKAGWQTHFYPGATVVHEGGRSTSQVRTTMMVQLFKSTHQFYRRHYPTWRVLQLRLLVIALMLVKLTRDRIWSYWATDFTSRRRLHENTIVWNQILSHMLRPATRSVHLAPESGRVRS